MDSTSNTQDPVEIAQALIQIDSINPDLEPKANGEREIADWTFDWMSHQGFEVHQVGNQDRPSVVGVMKGSGGGASIMLNGHIDTVGVSSYKSEPFSGSVRDGNIFGRGAFDMKAGVAAILSAAARCSNKALRGDIIVTLVADEEFGSIGTQAVLRQFSADAAIVTEPTEMNLVLAHRGFGWFEIELHGLAAHGSMPEQGVDAISHGVLVVGALDKLRTELEATQPHPLLGHSAVRVSMISAGSDAATVAERCLLTIERRYLPGETPDQVRTQLLQILTDLARKVPDFKFELRELVSRGAFEASKDWKIVETVSKAYENVTGRTAPIRGEPYWTDAGLIHEAGIPCLLIGVDGGGAHADEEWATVESIRNLTSILEQTISSFCA
ncbi:MAG: ArgE/DapE family deacylase [Cryobacterium sp.]|nr:ArgE/DapE family deacylase [Cryobacterium sp.]MBX3103752.1 ArgE/DapE family deacylase [Cryobacterium sp.]